MYYLYVYTHIYIYICIHILNTHEPIIFYIQWQIILYYISAVLSGMLPRARARADTLESRWNQWCPKEWGSYETAGLIESYSQFFTCSNFKPSCWPMFKPPSLGPPQFPLNERLAEDRWGGTAWHLECDAGLKKVVLFYEIDNTYDTCWHHCQPGLGRFFSCQFRGAEVLTFPAPPGSFTDEERMGERTWLIPPVVVCLSQRLSHACRSTSCETAKLRMAYYTSYSLFVDHSSLLFGLREPQTSYNIHRRCCTCRSA